MQSNESFNLLTKYVVGAKANPPKNPRRPLKKGMAIPTIMVNALRTNYGQY